MRIEAEGPASADLVWERYTRPSLWPGWAPQIRRVEATDDPIVAGTRGTVRGPLFTFAPFRIRYVDERARTWSWWVGLGPLGVGMDHGVDELVDEGDEGSRAWVRIHAHRYLVAPYVPVARGALRRLVRT